MKTAAEVKLESDSERTLIDRRRSMKLVGPGAKPVKKTPISITISNEIFSLPVPNRRLAPGPRPEPTRRKIEDGEDSAVKLVTVTTGIAILGAIVIGYFIGRNRD